MTKSNSGKASTGEERKWGKRGRPPAWWIAGFDSPLAAAAAGAREPAAKSPKAIDAKPKKRAAAKKAAATRRKGAVGRTFAEIPTASPEPGAPVLPFPKAAGLKTVAAEPTLLDQVLTPEGFSSILQSCLKHNVTRLRLGQVEIWMRPAKDASLPVEIPSSNASEVVRAVVTPTDMEDVELSQALIDDPEAFEQRLIDGHLKGAHGNGEAP